MTEVRRAATGLQAEMTAQDYFIVLLHLPHTLLVETRVVGVWIDGLWDPNFVSYRTLETLGEKLPLAQCQRIVEDPGFWERKALVDFKVVSEQFVNPNQIDNGILHPDLDDLQWAYLRYLQLLNKTLASEVTYGSEFFWSLRQCLLRASISEDQTLAVYFSNLMEQNLDPYYREAAVERAIFCQMDPDGPPTNLLEAAAHGNKVAFKLFERDGDIPCSRSELLVAGPYPDTSLVLEVEKLGLLKQIVSRDNWAVMVYLLPFHGTKLIDQVSYQGVDDMTIRLQDLVARSV